MDAMNAIDARDIENASRAHLIPLFLLGGICSEHLDEPIMTDRAWRRLCERLDDEWDTTQHPHKCLIEREALCVGDTAYLKVSDMPLAVLEGALLVRRGLAGRKALIKIIRKEAQ